LLIVFVSSAGELHNSPARVAFQVFRWLTFTILGGPDINGMHMAQVVLAKVVWTLPYEWVFYLALPLLALTVGIRPSWRYMALVLVAAGIAGVRHFEPIILFIFAGGILAAVLARHKGFCNFAASGVAAFLAIASLVAAVGLFSSGYGLAQVVLLTVFFCIIAAGNGLYGVLTQPAARKLGEMAYSVYMLHGVVLYTTFILILGAARARELSPMTHWFIVVGVTPVLLLVSHATFRFIESPFMRKTRDVESWLKSRLPMRLSRATS
jgi:peptidoglycan/LPS O-acetylase OafA/YrhL